MTALTRFLAMGMVLVLLQVVLGKQREWPEVTKDAS
ncbi:MAG: hypothetical protein ACI8P0_002561 [Planctomycetaceae bacterium]|jgi:hypothetical protein